MTEPDLKRFALRTSSYVWNMNFVPPGSRAGEAGGVCSACGVRSHSTVEKDVRSSLISSAVVVRAVLRKRTAFRSPPVPAV